jgi:hypothetical protein
MARAESGEEGPRLVAIDGATALPLDRGASVQISGVVVTSVDGSSFDVASLFDLGAGGLRIVESRSADHAYVLVPGGAPGAGCAAAGVASPCLVPRLAEIAHARLSTARDFAATLAGGIVVEGWAPAPRAPSVWDRAAPVAGWGLAASLSAWVLWVVVQRRAATPLGRVKRAARRARRAAGRDPALAAVRRAIAAMVGRAAELDAAQRACVRRLRAVGPAPEAEERAEADRIEVHRAACAAGLARIESALRWVALRAPAHAAAHAAARSTGDPVDVLAAEVALREQAVAEAEAVVAPR